MKLIKLRIKGFNSFFEEQIIDFQKLTNKGVFGIFGSTGSGKSSIIDAMTFALYGNVARYDTGEKRAFINSNTNRASVSFVFSITTDKTVFFEAEREIKRRDSGTIAHSARLIKRYDDFTEILAESPNDVTSYIIKIIGLDYKDFIRSVVLPQGKFSDFLMLKNVERRNMLERIFGLEEYGSLLSNAINERKKNQLKVVSDINSKLEIIGDVSSETLSQLKNDLTEKQNYFKNSKIELEEKKALFEKCKYFIDLKNELDSYKLKQSQLKQKKSDIDSKTQLLENAEKADALFDLLIDYKKSLEKYNNAFEKAQKFDSDFKKNKLEFDRIKTELDNFISEKNLRYPEIIKKEAELKHCSKIQNYIDSLVLKKNQLDVNYKKFQEELTQKNSELQNELLIKKDVQSSILNIENQKEAVSISPDYRNNIEYANNVEKKYIELKQSYEAELNRKNEVYLSVQNGKKQIDLISDNILDTKNKINDIKNQRNIIAEKYKNYKFNSSDISDISDIIEAQKKCEQCKALFVSKKEKFDKFLSLKNELEIVVDSKSDYQQKLNDVLNSEKEKNISLLDLDGKIKILENKEFILELAHNLRDDTPCPVCGSVHHPAPAEKLSDNLLEKLISQKISLKNDIEIILDSKSNLIGKISALNSEIDKLNQEIQKINDDINDFDPLKEKRLLDETIRDFDKIKTDFESWRKSKQNLDKKESDFNSILNELNIKLAETKSEFKKDSLILDKSRDLLDKINLDKNKNELELQNLKQKFDAESFNDEYLKLLGFEKQKSQLEKQEKINREILFQKQKNIELFKSEISEYEKNIEAINASLKEKNSVINDNLKIIRDILGDKNFTDYTNQISDEKSFFEKKESALNKEFQSIEIAKNSITESKIKAEKERDTLFKIQKDNFDKLNSSILEKGFNNIEDIEKYYFSEDSAAIIQNEIQNYNDQVKDINSNIKNILVKINKTNVYCDDEEFQHLKFQILELNNNIEEVISDIGKLKSKIAETETTFIKSKELKKEANIQTHKLNLISDLANTMKGNRFIEFISKRQLYYITQDASERLKKITNGRYSIEIENDLPSGEKSDSVDFKNSNFIIRDNFNGGAKRTPKSLSGGEVFLTSLSLALALSEKIQLKNNAPLETFFLDEGFGTLDSSVLDAVMDSLEQLSSEKINIGIITHVEEIKNRVQSKIMVEFSDEFFGSEIKI